MQVFRRLLGEAYETLPPAVQEFHDMAHDHYQGHASSSGDSNVLARTLRRIFGFPTLGEKMSVDVWLSQKDGRDCWQRKFGERRFSSSFHAGADGVLDERFGPFRFGFRLRAEGDRLYWDFVRWGIGALPLPLALGPSIVTYETQSTDGSYEFYSQADFPVIGRLVNYHGYIRPAG